jgi:hypothetical protein
MQTITEIHIKAVLDNEEFRRFSLNPPTFDNLRSTLQRLFNIQSNFSVKFQDDEKDWVLISSDEELLYAVELAGTPLRLQLNPMITPAKPEIAETQTEDGFRGAGRGWGRGKRGCRGRFGGEKPHFSKEERLAHKTSRLADRISGLETKINSGQLTTEREKVLRWRLVQLQDKLAWVTAVNASLKDAPPTPDVTAEAAGTTDDNTPPSEDSWGGRCHERKCGEKLRGRGCHLPPEVLAHFHQCRLELQAARASGNPEQIQAARTAFLSAKQHRFEARQQWLATKHAAKRGEAGAEHATL